MAAVSAPRGLAMAAILLLVAACGDDEAAPASTTSTTTTPSSTSTIETATTPGTRAAGPALLAAHADGIDLVAPDETTTILTGRPIALALPDRHGGIVFQESVDEYRPVPIEWIAAPGEDPEIIFEEDDARVIWLEDVTEIDDAATMVLRVGRTLPNDCPPTDEECRWEYDRDELVIRDLTSGMETVIGTVGSFESSGVAHSFGGPTVATTEYPYGSELTCVSVSGTAELLSDPEPSRWIGEGYEDQWLDYGVCCAGGWEQDCGGGYGTNRGLAAATAPDGSSVAIAWSSSGSETDSEPAHHTFAVLDPDTTDEVRRVEIGQPDLRPFWIDFDGTYAVIGRGRDLDAESVAPILVGPDNSITELGLEGRLTLWTDGS